MASVPAPKAFGVHRAEPRGRGRHRREARRVKLAGGSESNALQIERNLFCEGLAQLRFGRIHLTLRLLAK